jgi:putative PIN family toxin of toxin-antitoxin system
MAATSTSRVTAAEFALRERRMMHGPVAPIRAVLDTNIWLDLLVFRDPGTAALDQALRSGRLRACMDEFGAAELKRVLAYPLGRIRLDEAARAKVMAACQDLATIPPPAVPAVPAPPALPDGPACPVALPRCRDPHDQPFLELARACRANWLVTKDRDLLTLARRVARQASFQVLPPAAAALLLAASAAYATG